MPDLTPCVFCGTPRPHEVPRCPTCKRGWIDSHVIPPTPAQGSPPVPASAAVPVVAGVAGTEAEPSEPETEPSESDAPSEPETEPSESDAPSEPETEPSESDAPSEPETEPSESDAPSEPETEPSESEVDQPATSSAERVDDTPPPPVVAPMAPAASASDTSHRPVGDHPAGGRPTGGRPTGNRPAGDRPTGDRPVSPAPPAHPIDDESLHLDPPDREPSSAPRQSRIGQRLLVVGVVGVLIAGWFGILTWITRDDGPTADVAASTTTTQTGAATQAPVAGAGTTIPPPTTATTPEPTTTTADPTVLVGPFPETGNPVDISDLRLGAFAVGPIDFGDADGLGRLVATLGQPQSARTVDDGSFGLCPAEPGFTATWGPLTALFTGTPEDGALVGYRLDNEPAAHPTAGLSTLSELSLGDTIADLEVVYSGFDITFEEIDGTLSFVLVRSDDVTLLWGPVSSSEPDGTVLGIYSPEPCEGGPTPSG